MIMHQKGLTGTQIDSYRGYTYFPADLSPSQRSLHTLEFRPMTAVKIGGDGKNATNFYVIEKDHKKHFIPDGHTFGSLGLEFDFVVSLGQDAFDRIPEGGAIVLPAASVVDTFSVDMRRNQTN